MNIPLYHRIVATAAICLATTTGLNRCIGMPNNGGEIVARLYIEDISTSEDLYEDGSFLVLDEITAHFDYAGESNIIKIHNYNRAQEFFFEKGQSYQLSDRKKCEQLKTKSVVFLEEILPLCPTEIK